MSHSTAKCTGCCARPVYVWIRGAFQDVAQPRACTAASASSSPVAPTLCQPGTAGVQRARSAVAARHATAGSRRSFAITGNALLLPTHPSPPTSATRRTASWTPRGWRASPRCPSAWSRSSRTSRTQRCERVWWPCTADAPRIAAAPRTCLHKNRAMSLRQSTNRVACALGRHPAAPHVDLPPPPASRRQAAKNAMLGGDDDSGGGPRGARRAAFPVSFGRQDPKFLKMLQESQ